MVLCEAACEVDNVLSSSGQLKSVTVTLGLAAAVAIPRRARPVYDRWVLLNVLQQWWLARLVLHAASLHGGSVTSLAIECCVARSRHRRLRRRGDIIYPSLQSAQRTAHGTVLWSVGRVPRDAALLLFISVINRSWFIGQHVVASPRRRCQCPASVRPSVRPASVTAKNENLKRVVAAPVLRAERSVGWWKAAGCAAGLGPGGRAGWAGGVPRGTASIRYSLLTPLRPAVQCSAMQCSSVTTINASRHRRHDL